MTSHEEPARHQRDRRLCRFRRSRAIALAATMLTAFGGTLITGVQPAHAYACNGLQGNWDNGSGWMKGAYLDPECGQSGGSYTQFYYQNPELSTPRSYGTGTWWIGMGDYSIWVVYSPVSGNTGRFESYFYDANGQLVYYDNSVLTHTSS